MIAEFQESGYLVYLLSPKSNRMKHLMTLLAFVVAVTAGAQTEWPWNPDSDSDNIIGIEDLLSILSVFGSEFYIEYPAPANSAYTVALVQADSTVLGYTDCLGYCASIGGHIMTLEDFGLFHETVEDQAPYTYSGGSSNPPHQSFIQRAYLNPNSLERQMHQALYREIDIMTEDNSYGLSAGDTAFGRWAYTTYPLSYGFDHPNGNVATRAECFCVGTVPNPSFVGE